MKAYFHKSFVLDRKNIAKVLALAAENPRIDRQAIAAETGIGIGKNVSDGKVRPTIQYAIYSGLLQSESAESRNSILFSDVGKIVFAYDRWLESAVTQWVMHYFLCRAESEALIWSFFVHVFLQNHAEFNGDLLSEELKSWFVGLSQRNLRENRRILLNCYTSENALSKVGLIIAVEKDEYARVDNKHINAFLAAYILAEIWETKNADATMIDKSVLLKKGHLASTLGLNKENLQNCLDEINSIGAINQSSEAPPFQVVRRWNDKFDLLRRAYEAE